MKLELNFEPYDEFKDFVKLVQDELPFPDSISIHGQHSCISFLWKCLNESEHESVKFALTVHLTGHMVIGFSTRQQTMVSEFNVNFPLLNEIISLIRSGAFTENPEMISHYLSNLDFSRDSGHTLLN
jgi:hypothetical protein